MTANNRHKQFLTFVKKVLEAPSSYSRDDLIAFRNTALRNHPIIVPLIDEYINLAERSETAVTSVISTGHRKDAGMHLFDLLRDSRLFPTNADLAKFASKVLPKLYGYRFDKMGKGDIASRIITYLETQDPKTRKKLEASMMDYMKRSDKKPTDRNSFFNKWEKIIKNIEL